MLDFIICALTNLLRIYLIYRFSEIFSGKSEAGKKKVFCVCTAYYIANIALFWIYHMAWINIACNLIGIYAIARLHTKSIKTNVFVTCSTYMINMGCDVAVVVMFADYLDGQTFSQICEILTVLLILICWFLAGKIVTIHNNTEQTFKFSFVIVPLCSIAIILFLIYTEVCREVGIAAVSIGLLVINFFMLYLYNQSLYFVLKKYEAEMLEQKVQIYSNQLSIIMESERRTKALEHDLKHHINELKAFAQKYEVREISCYVQQMEEFMCNPEEAVASGNVEIDSVLNYMLQRAREELTEVDVNVILPENIKHSFDINVLLGNLLENAIEAARQSDRKVLYVDISLKKGIMKIQIDNSFRTVNMLQENGGKIFFSTKKRKEQHGIGLKNVKKIVESYQGDMDIEIAEDIFSVKTCLYMPETKNA